MIYTEILPCVEITDYVKSFWWFENCTNDQLNFSILPDGCFDLTVIFKDNIQTEISLTGLWTKEVEVPIEPNTQIFGIRFKLLAADCILNQKIASIRDSEKKMPYDFWNINQISFAQLEETAEIFNQIILSLLLNQSRVDKKKHKLFNLLYETNGELTVETYAQNVCWTGRQMNRYFNSRFGLSLKTYCNILKCFASLTHIKSGTLYPEQNYFDQAHFIKAIKKYTGSSPSTIFKNENARFLQLSMLKEK